MTGENDPNEGAQSEADLELENDGGELSEQESSPDSPEAYELPEFYLGPERKEGVAVYLIEPEEEAAEKQEEVLTTIERIREKIANLTNSLPYGVAQTSATVISIVNESLGTYLYHKCGLDPETSMQLIEGVRIGYTGIFAGNLALKTAENGVSHLKTAEGIIDMFTCATEVADMLKIFQLLGINPGNARAARLIKVLPKIMRRISTMMRTQKLGSSGHELEDKTMEKISERSMLEKAGIFAGIPLIFNMKEMDYTDLSDVLLELGFYTAITAFSYMNLKGVRTDINQGYTQRLEESRKQLEDMKNNFPELKPIVEQMLEENVDELSAGTRGAHEALRRFRKVMNPYGDLLNVKEGRIQPSTVDAVVMIHDIRSFTPLTGIVGDKIFHFLHQCYFGFFQSIVQKYNGAAFNDTGDGTLIYFIDAIDEKTGEVIPKELLALKCAEQLDKMTNHFAQLWRGNHEDIDFLHETGIAFTTGQFMIGDKRSPVIDDTADVGDEIKKIHELSKQFVDFVWPGLEKKVQLDNDVACMISALGDVINETARLEGKGGLVYSNNNAYMDPKFFEAISSLPPEYANETNEWLGRISPLGEEELKGYKEPVMIHGIKRKRYTQEDIKAATIAYAEKQQIGR